MPTSAKPRTDRDLPGIRTKDTQFEAFGAFLNNASVMKMKMKRTGAKRLSQTAEVSKLETTINSKAQ
jgi:hypothetical protein